MKKLKITTQKMTFEEGCNKYLEYCRQRNLRQGTINHYRQSYVQFFKPDTPIEDIDEDSVTIVEAVNGRKAGGDVVKAGRYQCKLIPLVKEDDDEYIRLKISTIPGYKLKINHIFLNMIKGY
jgi:hypothetical protein